MRLVRLVNSGIAEKRGKNAGGAAQDPRPPRRSRQISQLLFFDPSRHRGPRAVLPLRSP